jgi:D-alanyl-D-alanine carboxypeptidase/D-alanyl-D-alanine-endopeptidase (penicillin-binding protein 4)
MPPSPARPATPGSPATPGRLARRARSADRTARARSVSTGVALAVALLAGVAWGPSGRAGVSGVVPARLPAVGTAVARAQDAPSGEVRRVADAPDDAALARALGERVARAGLGDRVGVSVVSLRTGRAVFGHQADLPLNPASNQKLVTAATALVELGPSFRMLTALHGRVEGDAVIGGLYLRGYGDPTLRLADLVDLAEALQDRGVRRVDEVVVDGSYFDDRYVPPAFEQQPNETAAFRAPVSAVSVDGNAYELRVVPGAAAGEPATVRLDAAGYFDLTNEITTSASGEARVVAEQREAGDRLALRVRGSVPLGIRGVAYRRRVERPLPFAGHALVEALRRLGIRVGGRVRVGPTPPDAPMLASRRSPPLAHVLAALGKDSDNFVAETVLKVVGAERARPGRTEEGAARALALLGRAGVPEGAARIVNGSGLFDGNLIAASHLTSLLAFVYREPGLRAEYLAHLAVAGVDGTLARRMRDVPRGAVRAKTGTLADAVALSGYVLGASGDPLYAFAVLTNGVRGKQGAARALCDDVARLLVARGHPGYAPPAGAGTGAEDE